MAFRIFLGLLFVVYSVLSPLALGKTLHLWGENFTHPHHIHILKLALERAEPMFGKIAIKEVNANDLVDAFAELSDDKAGFDAVISAVDREREALFLPIYIPLNRGLLGFRLCLINPHQQRLFNAINKREDFSKQGVVLTQGRTWPDIEILEYNGIDVVVKDPEDERISSLFNDIAQCYSRSLIEVTQDQNKYQNVAVESSLMLVYPLADIIYFRHGASILKKAVEVGLNALIEDGTYMDEFYASYSEEFAFHRIYERKLLLLPHPNLSEEARNAINMHGLASFMSLEKEESSE